MLTTPRLLNRGGGRGLGASKAELLAEKARAELVTDEDEQSMGRFRFFEPVAPELLQAAAGGGGAEPTTTTKASSGKGKAKRQRPSTAVSSSQATAASGSPPPLHLIELLGCRSLASHLLSFLPSYATLRLGSTCSDGRDHVDAAITNISITNVISPSSMASDAAALAARFPILDSLAIMFSRNPPAISDFARHLAQETQLPTRLTRLTITGMHRYPRALDGLLAADWPRLTHVETDDVAYFLGRAQELAPALLARLRTLGSRSIDLRSEGLVKLGMGMPGGGEEDEGAESDRQHSVCADLIILWPVRLLVCMRLVNDSSIDLGNG